MFCEFFAACDRSCEVAELCDNFDIHDEALRKNLKLLLKDFCLGEPQKLPEAMETLWVREKAAPLAKPAGLSSLPLFALFRDTSSALQIRLQFSIFCKIALCSAKMVQTFGKIAPFWNGV